MGDPSIIVNQILIAGLVGFEQTNEDKLSQLFIQNM
jgi:hypothetical protein